MIDRPAESYECRRCNDLLETVRDAGRHSDAAYDLALADLRAHLAAEHPSIELAP